ncbi:MAG: cyclic nucleotide-binding domain-containing protein [Kofleriaceae bacterium]
MTVNLRELEKRLAQEPDNLPLRVTVAGMLHEAGRDADAIEHYRKVAIAYRDQGRPQQALMVCRSILELAPNDAAVKTLMAELAPAPAPPAVEPTKTGVRTKPGRSANDEVTRDPKRETTGTDVDLDEEDALTQPPAAAPAPRRSSFSAPTPLPQPIPYHLHDPTSDLAKIERDSDEHIQTRPGNSQMSPLPQEIDTTGLAQAARRISSLITPGTIPPPIRDAAAEVDTRQRPRVTQEQLAKVSAPPPTVPTEQVELDELITPPPIAPQRDTRPDALSDEDQTNPVDLLAAPITDIRANAFFTSLPAKGRDAAFARCIKRQLRKGQTVIRQGETNHPLYLVSTGTLEVRLASAAIPSVGAAALTRTLLETVEPGAYVGEASLLARTPAIAAVTAAEDSEVYALPPHALFELAGAYPQLWAALKDSAEKRNRAYDRLLRNP